MHPDYLSDVVIPASPCTKRCCNGPRTPIDEWLREAATLPHLRLNHPIVRNAEDAKRAWAEAMPLRAQDRRTAQMRAVRPFLDSGMTLAETAELLGLTPEQAALPFAGSVGDPETVLRVDDFCRAEPNWTRPRLARHARVSQDRAKSIANNLGHRQAIGRVSKYPTSIFPEIVRLREIEGLTFLAIADRLGVPRSSLGTMYRRAKQRAAIEAAA